MYRKEATALIQEVGDKSESDAEMYLDRIIKLYQPEFDPLKNDAHPISGTKASHLKGIVRTYVTNGQRL